MAKKPNTTLGTASFKIEFRTDGDGDVIAEIVELEKITMMTSNIEYITEDYGIYSSPGEHNWRDQLREVLKRRPNRRDK